MGTEDSDFDVETDGLGGFAKDGIDTVVQFGTDVKNRVVPMTGPAIMATGRGGMDDVLYFTQVHRNQMLLAKAAMARATEAMGALATGAAYIQSNYLLSDATSQATIADVTDAFDAPPPSAAQTADAQAAADAEARYRNFHPAAAGGDPFPGRTGPDNFRPTDPNEVRGPKTIHLGGNETVTIAGDDERVEVSQPGRRELENQREFGETYQGEARPLQGYEPYNPYAPRSLPVAEDFGGTTT